MVEQDGYDEVRDYRLSDKGATTTFIQNQHRVSVSSLEIQNKLSTSVQRKMNTDRVF